MAWCLLLFLLVARFWSTQALSTDPTIITDLRVVRGTSLAGAREACAAMCPCRHSLTKHVTSNWFLVGANLNTATVAATNTTTGDADAFVYLCMRRDRRAPVERSIAAFFAIQSIAVVERPQCPSSMKLLLMPRPEVAVCIQLLPMQLALAMGSFISDVDAVKANDLSTSSANDGWVLTPVSAQTSITSPAVFIRYRRPVRPILGVELLSNVKASSSDARACHTQLNKAWEPAGSAELTTSSGNREVLCVLRALAPVNGDAPPDLVVAARTLTRVVLVELSQACSSEFQEQLDLPPKRACLKYDDGSDPKFISQLQLLTKHVGDTTPWPADLSWTIQSNKVAGTSVHLIVHEGKPAVKKERALETQASKQAQGLVAKPLSQKTPLQARLAPDTATADKAELTFKILQLADLHLTGDPDHVCQAPPLEHARCGMQCTENLTIAFVNDLLDAEKPDLVVFSGDTVTAPDWKLKESALMSALAPVEDRNIPYAYIMGNHDDDYYFTREEIMDMLVKRDLAYVESGPTTIQGVGNYELNVQTPLTGAWGQEGDTVFRLYFLDSNKNHDAEAFPTIDSRYDWIRENQIEFYRNLSLGHRQENHAALPAIMFFHIPIPEYGGIGSFLFSHGEKNEKTEGPDYNSGLLSTLVEMGEVKATFTGHDHTNEYCYERHGVQLCYGGGTGFGQAYGDGDFARRARMVEWSVDGHNRRQIKSWKRHFGKTFHTRQHVEVLYRESA